MPRWICLKCGIVVDGQQYECCGVVEPFSVGKHQDTIISRSNAWVNVRRAWESNPLRKEAAAELAEEGCYSASAVMNCFIAKLIEKSHTAAQCGKGE